MKLQFMKGALMRLLDMFTEPDNRTLCGAKVAGFGTVAAFHATVWADMAINHTAFNMTAYAAAIAALFTSLGALLHLKPNSPMPLEVGAREMR
jgi:hypothetical protein